MLKSYKWIGWDGWDGRKSLKALILRAPLCGANNQYIWSPNFTFKYALKMFKYMCCSQWKGMIWGCMSILYSDYYVPLITPTCICYKSYKRMSWKNLFVAIYKQNIQIWMKLRNRRKIFSEPLSKSNQHTRICNSCRSWKRKICLISGSWALAMRSNQWKKQFTQLNTLPCATIYNFHSSHRTRGDLLRSVPLIMCGHLKMDFFQTSTASSFDTNPLSTCPMMIVKYSGQAPTPFPHPFHGMSAHEMSGHDP